MDVINVRYTSALASFRYSVFVSQRSVLQIMQEYSTRDVEHWILMDGKIVGSGKVIVEISFSAE